MTGIVYDTTKVTDKPTSFMDLFDPKYEGQVAMIDYPVTAIQVGALALGYEDPINLTPEQLEAVKNLYIEAKQRGQFRTFFSNDSEIVALFHTGEVVDRAWATRGTRWTRSARATRWSSRSARRGRSCGPAATPSARPARTSTPPTH